MQWEIVSNYKLLCSVNKKYIFYKKGGIYTGEYLNCKPRKLLSLPTKRWKRLFQSARLLERFLRLEPRVAIPLDDQDFLLSYQGQIFRIDSENGKWQAEHRYREGMNNPLGFCAFNDRILYGEYFGNVNHEEV